MESREEREREREEEEEEEEKESATSATLTASSVLLAMGHVIASLRALNQHLALRARLDVLDDP
jgi:hypothetical protein